MTLEITSSPYSAPIPYGVTIHPFASITVVDSNRHPNISAQVTAIGAGHKIQGSNLIGYNGTAHGTDYVISNLGSMYDPENLPPITAAQMTADLRSITYTSGEPDPASPNSTIAVMLSDGSANASIGFVAQDVAQVGPPPPPPPTPVAEVTQYYVNILQRTPDPGGLQYWSSEISSGMPAATAEQDIINSPEVQTYVVPAVELYTTIGRAPDAAGLSGWTHALEGWAKFECSGDGIHIVGGRPNHLRRHPHGG
jgi:hypothetical protein